MTSLQIKPSSVLASLIIFISGFCIFAFQPEIAAAQYNDILRASNDINKLNANGSSLNPKLNNSGRYLVFDSTATDLVADDTNGYRDIFIVDRNSYSTALISLDKDGELANDDSLQPSITSDGRYVLYHSKATDLVDDFDSSASVINIFLYDRSSKTTTQITLDTDGNAPNGDSTNGSISSDGKYIVFQSAASDLVAEDTNSATDIFLYKVSDKTITRISLDSDGNNADDDSSYPCISSDGAYVAYQSLASDIFSGDTNEKSDVFLYDTSAKTTTRISNDAQGNNADGDSLRPAISADGKKIVFDSDATDLVSGDTNNNRDVFLYSVADATNTRISLDINKNNSDGHSISATISADGKLVAFMSDATDLVSGDDNNTATDGNYDLFLYDSGDESIIRVSETHDGSNSDGSCSSATIDEDGTTVAFASNATNLVPNDDNELSDIFVYDADCPSDSDSDSTSNCTDACPYDADKTELGLCGCGTADTDSDADATPDCSDNCPNDANKIIEGTCGCGVADSDLNGNGEADCNDFTSETVPARPKIRYRRKRGLIIVRIPYQQGFKQAKYKVILSTIGNKKLARKRGRRLRIRLKRRNSWPCALKARYTATDSQGVKTKRSRFTTRNICR